MLSFQQETSIVHSKSKIKKPLVWFSVSSDYKPGLVSILCFCKTQLVKGKSLELNFTNFDPNMHWNIRSKTTRCIKRVTVLTSSKVSSYWPPSSLTMATLLSLRCLLQLLLTKSLHSLPGSMKELLNFIVPPPCFVKCFLPIKFLHKTTSPPLFRLTLVVVGRASTHKQGPVWESITDDPTTDRAPTILSHYPNLHRKTLEDTHLRFKIASKDNGTL